jgi:hypothetical protein
MYLKSIHDETYYYFSAEEVMVKMFTSNAVERGWTTNQNPYYLGSTSKYAVQMEQTQEITKEAYMIAYNKFVNGFLTFKYV